MLPTRALKYAQQHRPRFLAELKEFIRFPTISVEPQRSGDLKKCARWLAHHLRGIGFERTEIIPTRRHPIVYGSWTRASGRPTVLLYGHYDVVPVDPLHKWRLPPFNPTVRGTNLFGRGASDDKGQLFTHLKAIEAYLKTEHRLPINLKCIFEGEEEIQSPNLSRFLTRNKSALRADFAVMSDTQFRSTGHPAINYAERGLLTLEVELFGPGQDLHSGTFGGAVRNPLEALCALIAKLHDPSGRVAIPGFYRNVRQWSDMERAFMARTGPPDAEVLATGGVRYGWGEPGYSLYERTTVRPALSVNGIVGGYTGPGVKSVLPARAAAKLSFRLVPDQTPEEIDQLFRQYLTRSISPHLRWGVRTLSAARPVVIDRAHPAMHAAALAYRKAFGATPVFLRSGGTIPAVYLFQRILDIPTVLMGFGLPSDRIHSYNENFSLQNLFDGIATSIWFLALAAERLKSGTGVSWDTIENASAFA